MSVSTPSTGPGSSRVDAALLAACAREPIHLPGSIQPHGALVVVQPGDFQILQVSANAAHLLGIDTRVGHVLAPFEGSSLQAASLRAELTAWLATGEPSLQRWLLIDEQSFQMRAHVGRQGLLLEFEPASVEDAHALDRLYPRLQRFLDGIEAETDVNVLARLGATEVRRLTGFDRVLVYRFDDEWNGTVIAEDGNGRLPSYLDLRFPASDIPAQARELYRRSRLRLIPDARYEPQPMQPQASPLDGQPLDLSMAALRSVSPVHLEYMRNMGTDASMSISLLIDGKLWGLISCHHALPRVVGPQIRTACDFLGQMLALQISARERNADSLRRLANKDVESELLARASRAPSLTAGLAENPETWMRLVHAQGAAVLTEGSVITAGRAPTIEQLQGLAAWLRRTQPASNVWCTHHLPAHYSAAAAFCEVACGVLAVSISALHPHYVMWFRPEVIQTVNWGGEPTKSADDEGRLRPRRSFSMWTERVRGQSQRWLSSDVDVAASFRSAMVNFVLKRAEEQAALTEKLESSNRELEAFSYSVSHDLRAPFRHIVGFAQLLAEAEQNLAPRSRHYLDTIVDAALSAGRLVDDLLNFSQLGRSMLEMARIDMNKLVAEIKQSVKIDEGQRHVEWRVSALPPAVGDAALIRQAIVNLVDNAIKYTRGKELAVIEISGEDRAHETVYQVRDNGVGFDMAYASKLFGVFQRLHRVEEFKGSGIGLALARRVVDRHGGWISAESALNQGASFRFGLPKSPSAQKLDT